MVSPGLTKFTQALDLLDAFDVEEAGKLLVARLDDAALMRHRGYCFDEEPRRRERERERERASLDAAMHTVTQFRDQGVLPAPQVVDLPDGIVFDGEVYAADESVVFLSGESVLHEGRIYQKRIPGSTLPNDFSDTGVWVDVTPPVDEQEEGM